MSSADEPDGNSRRRVLLVGLGPTAASALEGLHGRCTVVALVRPGRDEVVSRAEELGICVSDDASIAGIGSLVDRCGPDAVVVSSYDRILPRELIDKAPVLNVHYSPLPRYRGRANVNWAVLNGEPTAAISIHELVPGLDAGSIHFQHEVAIGPRATVTELYEQLNALQRDHLAGAVQRFLDGDPGMPQDESDASYGCTRLPDDGEIDWSASTGAVDRLVRALTPPAPGAFTYLGLERLWVDRAEPVADAPRYEGRVPGRVVRTSRADGWVDVLTGDGVLRLHTLRTDDGAAVPAAAVIRSVKSSLGLRTTVLVERLHQLELALADLQKGARG